MSALNEMMTLSLLIMFIRTSSHPSLYPSITPSIHPSLHPSVTLLIRHSIHLSVLPPFRSFTRLSLHPFVRQLASSYDVWNLLAEIADPSDHLFFRFPAPPAPPRDRGHLWPRVTRSLQSFVVLSFLLLIRFCLLGLPRIVRPRAYTLRLAFRGFLSLSVSVTSVFRQSVDV